MDHPQPNPPLINSHNPNDYELLATIHSSRLITTFKARHKKLGILVMIKIFYNYMRLEDIYSLTRAIVLSKLLREHANVIGVYCSFKHGDRLWVIMPFVNDLQSLNSIMSSYFPHGMSEARMAFVLEETLKGIECVHEHASDLHGKIDLDHILVEDDGEDVKLDIGLLSYDDGNNEVYTNGERPVWMTAPDLKRSEKVDIWMFGLVAVELFYGKIPASDYGEFMSLVSGIRNLKRKKKRKTNEFLPSFIVKLVGWCFCLRKKMPSRLLGEVMGMCLDGNPMNRPTAGELLKHKFFRRAKKITLKGEIFKF